jgi:hypothetical protein
VRLFSSNAWGIPQPDGSDVVLVLALGPDALELELVGDLEVAGEV